MKPDALPNEIPQLDWDMPKIDFSRIGWTALLTVCAVLILVLA